MNLLSCSFKGEEDGWGMKRINSFTGMVQMNQEQVGLQSNMPVTTYTTGRKSGSIKKYLEKKEKS